MEQRLYRGKRVDTLEWVYGWLVLDKGKAYILPTIADMSYGDNGKRIRIGCFVEVIPDTVGQHTGLTDKNGTKIFEGDIVKYADGYGVIAWSTSNFAYMCVEENGDYWEWLSNMDKIEVIGNIHDNPELLTSKDGE